jgi:hypothetical protein
MILDRWYRKHYAPKKKKNSAVAWVLGALAFLALCPLAVKRDKEKGEWGIASLLLFIGCRPSVTKEVEREITISIPGYPHVKSILQSVCGCCQKKAPKAQETGEAGEDEDFDLAELMGETSDNTDPEVIIAEE